MQTNAGGSTRPRPADDADPPAEVAKPPRDGARPEVAVILAAGNGTRMRGAVPKPLMRILGVRLIERAILALRAAGVQRFVVVTGAHGDVVVRELARLRRLRGLAIETVTCETWERGNGHSLACGAAAAGGPFYLAMADHVFDPAIAVRLGDAAAARPEDVHLATDAHIGDVFDLDDATKVAATGDTIVAIGKDLPAYDRIDVGLFACPASLAAVAAAMVGQGASSVSDVMREVIRAGRMRSVPVEGLVWQDVDTPAMGREAERRLLASARKSTDGPVSRYLNRPLSLALTRVLARVHVTPNQVTTLVFLLGMVAAVLIAHGTAVGSWRELVLAAVVTQLASVIDGCDGELARVALRASRFGAWYDTITDNIRYAAMVSACAVGLYLRTHAPGFLIAGGAFVVGAIYLVAMMTAYLRRTAAPGTHLVIVDRVETAAARARSRVVRVLYATRTLVKQDVLALLAVIALVSGYVEIMLVCGLIAVASMIVVVDRALQIGRGPRFVLGTAGAALFVWLLTRAPIGEIATALETVGWPVLLGIPVVLLWMLANSLGLRALLHQRVGVARLLHQRVIGDGFNALVPAGGVGGEPLRVAMLRAHVPIGDAAIAIVSDRAINLAAGLITSAVAFAIALFTLALPASVRAGVGIYVAIALAGAALLVVLVHGDVSGRVVARVGGWLGVEDVHRAPVRARVIAVAVAWHVIGRSIAGVEVFLYAYLLGMPLSFAEVAFVTGTLHAVGVAMFMVPQGIGVSEAAVVYAVHALGYPASLGLALGLVRRARVLVFSAAAVALHLARRAARTPSA